MKEESKCSKKALRVRFKEDLDQYYGKVADAEQHESAQVASHIFEEVKQISVDEHLEEAKDRLVTLDVSIEHLRTKAYEFWGSVKKAR